MNRAVLDAMLETTTMPITVDHFMTQNDYQEANSIWSQLKNESKQPALSVFFWRQTATSRLQLARFFLCDLPFRLRLQIIRCLLPDAPRAS